MVGKHKSSKVTNSELPVAPNTLLEGKVRNKRKTCSVHFSNQEMAGDFQNI